MNLNFAHRSAFCTPRSIAFRPCSSSSYLFSSPILPRGERLIGVYYLSCPFLVGSLGSRAIIDFPPRKTARFNEYYVRTRYPARGIASIARDTNRRSRSFLHHGVAASLDCRSSNREVYRGLFTRLKTYNVFPTPVLTYVLAKLASTRTITSLITPDVPRRV